MAAPPSRRSIEAEVAADATGRRTAIGRSKHDALTDCAETAIRRQGTKSVMNINDLVLVSIDDHVVEPPNMFDGRLGGEVRRRRAAGRQGRQRRRPLDVPRQPDRRRRPQRRRVVAEDRMGLRPDRLRRDAPRLLRHPRPRARHGRQRHHRVDVLPDVRRLQRRPLPPRQGRDDQRHDPGLQRLAHRGLVRRLPRPLHPAVDRAELGPGGDRRRDQARSPPRAPRRSRCPSCRTSTGCPATTTWTTGARSSRR